MGNCVLRETIRKGRPRFAPRVSLSYLILSLYLSLGTYGYRDMSLRAVTEIVRV